MKAASIIITFAFCLIFFSCGTTLPISSGQFSDQENYKVNEYAGCCGCSAKYINIYQGKRIKEQLIYRYNCYPPGGMPTKYVFTYSKRGRLIYCNKYVATLNNDFTIAISDYEKQFIRSLKKDSLLFLNHDTIKMKDIKGFKKPGVTDATQVFPFVKHGTKIKIQ